MLLSWLKKRFYSCFLSLTIIKAHNESCFINFCTCLAVYMCECTFLQGDYKWTDPVKLNLPRQNGGVWAMQLFFISLFILNAWSMSCCRFFSSLGVQILSACEVLRQTPCSEHKVGPSVWLPPDWVCDGTVHEHWVWVELPVQWQQEIIIRA